MVKSDDITDRLHSLNRERQSNRHVTLGKTPPSGADFQFRPLAKDHFAILIYIILGMTFFGQLILVILID